MKNKATIIIFLIMLLIRFADVSVFNLIFSSRIPDWFKYLYSVTIYTLVIILLWQNNKHLFKLNIDKPLLSILLITGVVLILWYLPFNIGLFILILMGFLLWASKNNFLIYRSFHINPLKLGVYILIALVPLFVSLLLVVFKGISIPLAAGSFIDHFLNANLIGVVFEEVLFRGLLWMLLVDMNINERVVVYIQALIFWLSHYNYLIDSRSFTFWMALPFLGIFFGYIIYKEKSITPSIICHFIHNFTSSMLFR